MLVIHLSFCTGDLLNCMRTKMSLNKKRKTSAIASIRLGIPVDDGKWADSVHFPYSVIGHVCHMTSTTEIFLH